jgi:hypothetical protein
MNTDGPRVGKLFVFSVTGQAEVVVVVCFDQLGPTGPSMGIMTIEAEDPCIEMTALLKVEPLLMMGFKMGLRISPDSRFKLVVVGQEVSYFIGSVVLVIPWEFTRRIWTRTLLQPSSTRGRYYGSLHNSFEKISP